MDGARVLAGMGRPKGRASLLGEPTGMVPARMHKGMNVNAIRLHGRSGHSSDPRLGANALDVMYPVLGEIIAFREELAREHRHPAFDVDYPTMNLGCLHAGDNPNRICGAAELQIDMRVLPGMDNDVVQRALEKRLSGIEKGTGVRLEIEQLHPPVPPYETPADSVLVRSVERLTGDRAGAVAFGTEAPFFHQIGMDAVVCGPGYIDQAHQPDEYLAMANIEPSLDLIRGLVRDLCVKGESA